MSARLNQNDRMQVYVCVCMRVRLNERVPFSHNGPHMKYLLYSYAERAEFCDFKIGIITDSDKCLLNCCACNWRLVHRGFANNGATTKVRCLFCMQFVLTLVMTFVTHAHNY